MYLKCKKYLLCRITHFRINIIESITDALFVHHFNIAACAQTLLLDSFIYNNTVNQNLFVNNIVL